MNFKNIPNYDGLYGEQSARHSGEYIFLELIATRSQHFDWNIQPHIHAQLYQVFFVQNGHIIFTEETKTHQIVAPCVFLVPPTMLHGLQYSTDTEGYILTLSENVVEDIFQTSKIKNPVTSIWRSIDKIQIITAFEEVDFVEIIRFVNQMEQELFSEQLERSTMLNAQITQLFVLLHRLAHKGKENKTDGLAMGYFRRFQKSIKQSQFPKSVPEFADELNITAVHLNRVCNTIVGKSATDLIYQHLIEQAQKYLLHTSYSASEIAYLLKFEYPSYFGRFFKKHVGMTPLEFRERERG